MVNHQHIVQMSAHLVQINAAQMQSFLNLKRQSKMSSMEFCKIHDYWHPLFFECAHCAKEKEQRSVQELLVMINNQERELIQLREEMQRLQAAHDHQYKMAGLMLREAELAGREANQLRKEVDLAYKVCARICRQVADHSDDTSTWGMASAESWNSACERAALAIEIFAENRGK
jgi:hypothetical protein